jgi:hypothetical protein
VYDDVTQSIAHICGDDIGKRVLDTINKRMHALRASASFLQGVGGRTDRVGGAGGRRTKEREGGRGQIMWRGMACVEFSLAELTIGWRAEAMACITCMLGPAAQCFPFACVCR